MNNEIKNKIDYAYCIGVFNVSGIDGLGNELKRLQSIGKLPHEMFTDINNIEPVDKLQNQSTRKFEELTEVERTLRSLIYSVETRDKHHPNHPMPLGEAYLSKSLIEAKEVAHRLNIPLIEIDF